MSDVTVYYWNWWQAARSIIKMQVCYTIGMWGLVFDNDSGYMQNACHRLLGGSEVTFPVNFSSQYSDDYATTPFNGTPEEEQSPLQRSEIL